MINNILIKEAKDSYNFLIDHTNFEDNSPGYGLTLDRTSNKDAASVAGSGFMLSGLVIGVVRNWDDYQTNLKRAQLTLQNFYHKIPHFEGMFAHYLDYSTGKRYKKCEYSTIDTAIFINGMLTVDSFFDDSLIKEYTKKIYQRINWNKFIFEHHGRFVFRMAYNDICGGDYLRDNEQGWIHHWSMFAEQLSMYILAAGSDNINEKLAKKLFFGFDRTIGGYDDYQFVYTPLGSLFTHQYSHSWFDFSKYNDLAGFDWFNNSIQATLGNYQYCKNQKDKYKTFNHFWGLSPCDGPKGYSGYGAPPFNNYENVEGFDKRTDGTVALYALVASLPFCPEVVKNSVLEITEKYPELLGPYGFYDSINLENELWIGKDYISIDKGITLLMIDNYYHQTNWKYYMQHNLVKNAIEKLAFRRKEV